MAGGWVDTTDVAILVVFAAAVFYYFSRGKKTTPPPQGKKLDTKAPSTSSLKVDSSNAGGLNGKMNKLGKDVVIFYGSQTGTAEDYANRLAREGKQYGFQAMVADLEDYELSELADLESNKLVIFAVATYGEGEPTDNAQEAFKFLNEEHEADLFKNLHYTVFGLGNKTYEHYNEVGKHFDAKLEAFGAKRVFELGLGDDDGSLEEDYVTWRDKMWPTVGSLFGKEADQNAKASRQYAFEELDASTVDLARVFKGEIGKLPKPGAIQSSPPYDLKNPYLAEIVVNRELMKGGDRNCMHIEVKIKDTPLTYQTGDHLGIFPQNDPEYVERLGKRLGLTNLDQLITLKAVDASAPKKHPFPCPTTYRAALSHYLDIHSVCRTHILKALLEYVSDEAEKAQIQRLISVEGKEEMTKFLQLDGRGILEVLEFFPSAQPPADLLFELLPRLQCRYYSISSSPEVHPETISITATVSNYVTASGRFGKGVCTNFLFDKKNPELQTYRIPVFVRRSNFKLPKILTKPIIMVGPGTGLAPFRGFIEERAKKRADGKSVGPNVLFFGCRRRDEDFLYQEELEKYKESGDLELFTAFSRETEKKVYVQHLIAEQKKLVWGYLEQGAIFYICGDAKNMARDVNKALQEIVRELGNKTDDEALQFVKNLRTTGRYLEDVWS